MSVDHAPAPGRFRQGDSPYHLLLRSDSTTPIGLTLANPPTAPKGHPVRIGVQYLPELGPDQQYVEWRWQNGPAGAGYSRETPLSYQQGGSDYGAFCWLRQDGSVTAAGKLVEIPLPPTLSAILTGRIFDAFEYGAAQDLYILTGTRYLISLGGGTANPGIVRDFGAGTALGNAALFDGKAYVSLGSSAPIQEFNGSIWQAANAGTERSRLGSVNWLLGNAIATGSGMSGGDDVESLLGTDPSGSGFYHVVGDPKVNANWSSLIPIGDPHFAIQNMVTDGHVAWFGKPNGVHGVNGLGSARNISKWFELASNPNNCGCIVYWNGAIWSVHQQGLVMIPVTGERQDVATFVQFGYDKTSMSPIWGRPRWLCPSPEGLFVAYYNATTGLSYIGCLRMSGNQLRWSMAECIVPGEVTWMRVTSPGGVPRLLIGTLDASNVMHLWQQDQPESGDPLTDYLHGGNFRPAPEWSLSLSRFNGGTPIEKTFRRHTMETENLGDGNTIEFQIAGDDPDTFTTQGTATVSPYWTGTPTDALVRAVSAQIKLLCHNAATAPIVIRAVEERYSPHPELQKVKTYPVVFGEGVTRKDGQPDDQDPRITLARFEACLSDDLIECIDEFGFTIEGIVETQVSMVEYEEAATKGFTAYGTVSLSTSRAVARFDEAIHDVDIFS